MEYLDYLKQQLRQLEEEKRKIEFQIKLVEGK